MKVIDYHRDTGHKPGLLVETGRQYLHILLNEDTGLIVRKVPLSEQRYIRELDYPLRRALARFRKIARKQGLRNLSKRVRQALSV